MEENDGAMGQMDEASDRQREMTEERKERRKRILKGVAVGVGVAAGVGAAVAGCGYVMELLNSPDYFPVVGGAMGQWEEVPMQRAA